MGISFSAGEAQLKHLNIRKEGNEEDAITAIDLKIECETSAAVLIPLLGQRKPSDPGVAVYFTLDGKDRCIPCDMYLRIEDNLAAVAATLEALRTIERHGSQMFEAAFTGFDALPSPDHLMARSWRDVLDYYGNSVSEAELQYQRKRKNAHPDHGGDAKTFHAVNVAWEQARQELE